MVVPYSQKRLPGNFGVELTDIDVRHVSDEDLRELLLTLYEHRIMVLKTGGLLSDDYIEFARRIGEPLRVADKTEHPELIPITNVGADTKKSKRGAAHWHTDQSFTKRRASVTMLYSLQAPAAGGETLFCDMVAAYDALEQEVKKQIDNLTVVHRHGVSIAARPGDHVPVPPKGWDQTQAVEHPLVRRHPITGQKTLYAITGTSQGIKGMDPGAAKMLLNELCEHAFRDPFVTSYKHSVGDLLMWDNPTTMHRATPIGAATGPKDTRLIHRISLRGTPSVFADSERFD